MDRVSRASGIAKASSAVDDESIGAESVVVDQRSARRQRGRESVISAVLELIHEHGAIPASTEIASRAGVSPASLFRYFDSLDDLQHEAVRQHFESNHEFFAVPRIGEGALDERIATFVDARIALHNRIAPVARFGRGRVVEVPYFAQSISAVRLEQSRQVRVHFASELRPMRRSAADDLVAVITTMTSFESWDLQRSDLGRSDRQVRRSWVDALAGLLGPG